MHPAVEEVDNVVHGVGNLRRVCNYFWHMLVFQMLRYLSGVMVPLALLEDRGPKILHLILSWNPLVWIIDIYRWVFLGSAPGMGWAEVLITVMTTCLLIIGGLKFFTSAEHRYGRP